jgi:hypothetical protein
MQIGIGSATKANALTLCVWKENDLTRSVWKANTLALVRMPNNVAHLVRTVAIYLAIHRSVGATL